MLAFVQVFVYSETFVHKCFIYKVAQNSQILFHVFVRTFKIFIASHSFMSAVSNTALNSHHLFEVFMLLSVLLGSPCTGASLPQLAVKWCKAAKVFRALQSNDKFRILSGLSS